MMTMKIFVMKNQLKKHSWKIKQHNDQFFKNQRYWDIDLEHHSN